MNRFLQKGVDLTVAFLLAVVVVLLCTRQTERDYTFAVLVLIGALIGLAIKINLLSILGDIFALALENWLSIVIALSAAIVLIVPALMIYVAVRDELDKPVHQRVDNRRRNVRH